MPDARAQARAEHAAHPRERRTWPEKPYPRLYTSSIPVSAHAAIARQDASDALCAHGVEDPGGRFAWRRAHPAMSAHTDEHVREAADALAASAAQHARGA